MQHQLSSTLPHDGHLSMGLVLKFLALAALGAFVIVSQSIALFIAVGLGIVFYLAIQERVQRLEAGRTQTYPGHRVSDGGSFPRAEPPLQRPSISKPTVLDGGCLEHHRR